MADEFIKIEVHDQETQRLFAELYKNMNDLSPVMKVIGEIIKTSVKKNFEVGGRYSSVGSWKGGTRSWQPLSIVTLFAKPSKYVGKRGKFKKGAERRLQNRKILFKEGHLFDSIHYTASSDRVSVGPDKIAYGTIHNEGGMAGRGKKVKIPARPYLVVQDEDMQEINHVLIKFIVEGRA